MAVSVDTAEDSVGLTERLSLPFALLSDPDRHVVTRYGVADEANEIAVPAVFVISRDGRVIWRHVGEDMRDRPSSEQVLDVLRSNAPAG